MKKAISFLLSCTMVISMVSTTALAAETDILNTQDASQEYVINKDGTRNGSVTIADIDELYFELDEAVLLEDKEAEATIREELEDAGVRQVSFSEVLAKTGGANSAISTLAASNIEFEEVTSEIRIDGKYIEIMHIYARPQRGSDMFHSYDIRIDAEPNLRAGVFNAFESTATFVGGAIPEVGIYVSALATLNSIVGGFTAQDLVETFDADVTAQCIENTVFMYFWNKNTNNWTHIGTGNYIAQRLIPEYVNIVTDKETHVDRFTDDEIPVIVRNLYNTDWDDASVAYDYWKYYGPCTLYQVKKVTITVPDGNNNDTRDYIVSMKCPHIPAIYS